MNDTDAVQREPTQLSDCLRGSELFQRSDLQHADLSDCLRGSELDQS